LSMLQLVYSISDTLLRFETTEYCRTGDRGRTRDSIPGARHLSWYVTSHPGQLSLAIPSWVGTMSNGDALRLGSKGRYGSCVGGRYDCDPIVTHGPYLSAFEIKGL